MSNQIVITSGAKLRDLDDVIIGTDGILSSVAFNVANGVPRLDENGKILVSQLPNSVMEFKGVWNAATNTPTLVNGTGNAGDVWLCNVAGTVNFGAGPIAFAVGDYAVYTGTVWARSSGATGTVTSVGVSRDGNALTITGSPVTTSGTINLGFSGDNTQYINGAGNLTTFPTLITSIGLTMPAAFGVSNSPLTANGTIGVTALGYPSQYIRGDGTLADFPTSGGGGSSVSYYFNGGTSQGTIGGTTYYEMSKTADTGTGVDFNKTGNGFIVAFLTDANDPNLLEIPAGNWDFEIYASMSANGGTPELYAELYKYDGTTFTLIATSSHEILYDGVNLNLYSFATAVPQTSLTVTDRLAIKLYADNSGGKTTTIHTQNGHLCQVITTFSTGLTALNGLTAQVQYFGTGTSGSDFNIVSSVDTHTFNLPTASATKRGALSSADWSTFNGKQDYITAGTTLEYWRGDKTWQTLNTSVVPELTNLYFTNARARTAISLTTTGSTGASTYDNSTGVLNIPNYVDQYVGTVTSVGLSAPTGFSVSGSPVTTSGTLALSFASGYSLPTNVKQSNWDDAYTWVAAFPTQTGNTGKFLTTDGSSLSWAANPLGTVTSVDMSVPTGLTVSGNPITTSGTLAVTLTAGYSIPTTANQSTWTTAYNRSLTSAAVTGTTTKTLTLNQQDGGTITASWTDINTDAVTSVFGRTGAVVATDGDYTLTQLGDVTITTPSSGQVLKYNGTFWINDTDANTGTVTSVAMTVPTGLSIAGSPITSSGTLAVTFAAGYSIPTNASQTTWDTAYTNRITSLTTTGTSGAATLTSNVLNIPQYQSVLTNPVTGTGTTNTLPKFTGSSTIGDSLFTDNGTNGAFGGANYSSGTGVRTFNITAPQFSGIAFWTGTSQSTGNIFSYQSTGNLILNADPTNTLSSSSVILAADDITIGTFNTTNVTLTRALIGTSATFSSLTAGYITKANSGGLLGNSIIYDSGGSIPKIAINGTTITDGNLLNIQGDQSSVNIGLVLNNTNATYPRIYSIQNVNNSLVFYDYTANAPRLTISSTGASTFSSTITATQGTFSGTNNSVILNSTDAAYATFQRSGTNYGFIGTAGTLTDIISGAAAGDLTIRAQQKMIFSTGGDVARLTIVATGGATFSKSVTVVEDVKALNFGLIDTTFRGGIYTYKGISGGGTDYGIAIFAEGGTGNGNIYFCPNGSATKFMSITTSSTVLVNTASGVTGGGTLQVNGNVNINGVFQINGVTIGGGGGGGVTGAGTLGYHSRWTSSTSLGNSVIYDDGTNVGINTTSVPGLLTLRAAVSNTPSLVFQNVLGGPNSAISNYVSSAQTYTIIGTNAYVTNTANIARFSASFAGSYIAFDEGTMVFGTGNSSEIPSGRMFLSPTGLLTVNNTIRSSNYGLVRASLFRGGLYTYDAVLGAGSDYGLTLFAEGGSGGGNIYFCPGGSYRAMTVNTSNNVLIGTSTDNGYRLQVSGDLYVSGSSIYVGGVTYSGIQTFNNLVYLNSTTYVASGQGITWKGSSGTTYDFSISNSGTVPYILSSAEVDLNAPIGMRYGLIYTFKGNGSSAYNVNVFNSGVAADELQFLGGLRLNTTTCGFIPPKMTTTQKNALSASVKVAGCIVYDTTVNLLQAWNGSTWNNLW